MSDLNDAIKESAGPYDTATHTERLRIERRLQEIGGVSRTQVRDSLKQAVQDFRRRQIEPTPQIHHQPPAPTPMVQSGESKLEMQPFRLETEAGAAPGGGDSAAEGTAFTFSAAENGAISQFRIYATRV